MAERIIPVEQETGIPLAVEPNNSLAPTGVPFANAAFHHATYPAGRAELKPNPDNTLMEDSAQAIRQGRQEWLADRDHKTYHNKFDKFMAEEWAFPATVEERTVPVTLFAADYIPAQGIRIRNDSAQYVEFSERTRDQMRREGIISVISEEVVFQFLRDFILDQDLSDVTEVSIEELVLTSNITQRFVLGNKLLRVAIDRAAENVRPAYARAYRERLIKPEAPADPVEFILEDRMLFGSAKRQRVARAWLRMTLARQYDENYDRAA